MPGFWSKLFPRRSLIGLRKPARVDLEAYVASENLVTSPVSGQTAAFFAWHLTALGVDGLPHKWRVPFESGVWGERLLLAADGGSTLQCAPRGNVFHFGPAWVPWRREAWPPDQPWPPELEHLRERAAGARQPHYEERALRRGDAVRFVGCVEPAGAGEGPYRSGATADFVHAPNLGPYVFMLVVPTPGAGSRPREQG